MDGEAVTGIKFFDLSSRLNRLRYFSYGIAVSWVSIPIHMVGLSFMLHHSLLLSGIIDLAAGLLGIPIQFTFMIRRLHDLDRSGWWSLIYAPMTLFFFLAGLGIKPAGFMAIFLLLCLVNLGLFLMLLFSPGTPAENRFGAPPPPNSTWVVIGAWSALPLFIFTFLTEILLVASVVNRATLSRDSYAATIARRGIEQALPLPRRPPRMAHGLQQRRGRRPGARLVLQDLDPQVPGRVLRHHRHGLGIDGRPRDGSLDHGRRRELALRACLHRSHAERILAGELPGRPSSHPLRTAPLRHNLPMPRRWRGMFF